MTTCHRMSAGRTAYRVRRQCGDGGETPWSRPRWTIASVLMLSFELFGRASGRPRGRVGHPATPTAPLTAPVGPVTLVRWSRGHTLIAVLDDRRVSHDLSQGQLPCPACRSPLRSWGSARSRPVRQADGSTPPGLPAASPLPHLPTHPRPPPGCLPTPQRLQHHRHRHRPPRRRVRPQPPHRDHRPEPARRDRTQLAALRPPRHRPPLPARRTGPAASSPTCSPAWPLSPPHWPRH